VTGEHFANCKPDARCQFHDVVGDDGETVKCALTSPSIEALPKGGRARVAAAAVRRA
jgi:hypothetical protein